MSEYKRLTNNNLEEYNPEYDFCVGCKYFGEPNGCNRQNGTCDNYERFIETYNRLAELEDKMENGTLMELPCKVGDRIWAILGNNIFGRKVKSIVIRSDGYTIKTSNKNGWKDLEPYYNAEFGVIWFLTKAEAEAQLKELQEGKK